MLCLNYVLVIMLRFCEGLIADFKLLHPAYDTHHFLFCRLHYLPPWLDLATVLRQQNRNNSPYLLVAILTIAEESNQRSRRRGYSTMVRKESPVSAEQADDQMNRSPGREKTFRYPPRDPRQGSHDAADEKIPFKRSKKLHSVLARMRELREKELSGLHEKSQSATSSQFSSDSAFSPNNESERHQRPDQRDELSVRDPDDPQLDHSHDLVNASRDGQCMRDHSNTIQAPSAPLGRGLLSPGKSTGHPVVAGDLSSRPREEVLRDQIREATREKIYLDSIPTSRGENAPSGVGESVTDEETTEQIYSSGTRENFGAAHRAPSYKEKHRSKSPSRSHRDSRVLGRNVHQGAYSAQSPRRSRGHVKSASAQEGGKRYPMDGAPQSTSGKERALIGEAGRKTGRRIQNLQTLSSDDDTEEIFHNDDQEAQRRVNVLHGPRLSTSLDAKTRSPSKTNGHMDLRSLSSDSGEDASTLSIEDESTGSSSGYGSTGSSSSEYSSIRPRRGQIYDNRSNAKPSSRANLKNRYSASSAPTVNNEKGKCIPSDESYGALSRLTLSFPLRNQFSESRFRVADRPPAC
jgi:hypothetical protein